VSRNKSEQDRAFVINDLVYKFRRLPILYLLPVLIVSMRRTLKGKVRKSVNNKEAIRSFIKLIPSQLKYVSRVSVKTYNRYRTLSNSYLAYLSENKS